MNCQRCGKNPSRLTRSRRHRCGTCRKLVCRRCCGSRHECVDCQSKREHPEERISADVLNMIEAEVGINNGEEIL